MMEGNDQGRIPNAASPTGSCSRRTFLGLTGMAAGTLALGKQLYAQGTGAAAAIDFPAAQIAGTHDLISLPSWGPYSKKYFGISHIPDLQRGLSFDLSIFPVLIGEQVVLPSVLLDQSQVHPWEAAPHLEFYSYRFELLWKNRLYCDLSFSEINDAERLVRMEIVNHTSTEREIVLNTLSQLCFPPLHEGTVEPIRLCEVEIPQNGVWINAVNYADLRFHKQRPTDSLVRDGRMRAEERHHDAVDGSVVGQDFGLDAGDEVRYKVELKQPIQDAILVWRFQIPKDRHVVFLMTGAASGEVAFQGDGSFRTVATHLGPMTTGTHELRFTSKGGAGIMLNGFAVVDSDTESHLRFKPKQWHPLPEISKAGKAGMMLKYEDLANSYGISLDASFVGQREIKWRNLDQAFGSMADRRTYPHIFGSGNEHDAGNPDALFLHTWSKPITLPANSTRVIYGSVSTGSEESVRAALERFDPHSTKNERAFRKARNKTFRVATLPEGETFRTSQQLLAAVTMTNLVYPLYTQRSQIRHYSPGRCWDSLYTWDAGFVGLGLLEIDLRCTIDSLNAYTTPEGSQSAFILHGTPLPVQIYLCVELWNRTQSRELLSYFYPRLRQFHRFLAGRLGSSTTRRHRDHLITTWDYFYNSGGWDDYPPQRFVHEHKLEPSASPVVNSAHTIRCARLLRQMAEALGQTEDFDEYDRDVETLSASLQKLSWDQESGYFGYVMRDESGEPTGILRTSQGVNYNMGLDGVYPLVAGICSVGQEDGMLAHLFSPDHLWTDIGITTVDQAAPYYEADGYWNGSVWLAHQWFLWKTMLDLGKGQRAIQIAQAGLAIWKKVTDETYKSREHFKPHQPFDDGFGWSQLSSLSSPALTWFAALYTPGRITCGFNTWITACRFSKGEKELTATLKSTKCTERQSFSMLVCMNPSATYRVRWNGMPAKFIVVHSGLLQVEIPYTPSVGELSILAS